MALDFRTLIGQKDELIRRYREKKYKSIVGDSKLIRVFEGEDRFSGPREITVGGTRLTGSRFLVATGSSPMVPEIPGLKETHYHTSDLLTSLEIMELTELPESLIILGGGYIAPELGQMFFRFGTRVSILERNQRVLSAYEPKIAQSVTEVFQSEGITLRRRKYPCPGFGWLSNRLPTQSRFLLL